MLPKSMPTDFAAKVRKPNKRLKKSKPTKSNAHRNNRELNFHGPSFSAGTILGAIIVFLMAYAPEFIINNSPALSDIENSFNEPEQKVEITFPKLLKEFQVRTDTSIYKIAPKKNIDNTIGSDFLYQTASFRNPLDAQKLRAKLLLNNLKADIKIKTLNKVQWHRVLIGPFEDKDSADQAISKLNELSIPAIKVNTDN